MLLLQLLQVLQLLELLQVLVLREVPHARGRHLRLNLLLLLNLNAGHLLMLLLLLLHYGWHGRDRPLFPGHRSLELNGFSHRLGGRRLGRRCHGRRCHGRRCHGRRCRGSRLDRILRRGDGRGSDGNIVRDGHCLDVRTDRCDRYGRRRRLRLRLGLGDGCRHSGHRL